MNFPPSDAVSNMHAVAPAPAIPWMRRVRVESHTPPPLRQRTTRTPKANPPPLSDKSILLARSALFNASPGADERPLRIANGVARRPNANAAWATASPAPWRSLNVEGSIGAIMQKTKARPASAKPPTTSSDRKSVV